MKTFKEKYFGTNDEHPQTTQVEDLLFQDEQILEHLTPYKKAYLWSQLLFNISSVLIWMVADGLFIFFFIKFKFYEENLGTFIFLMCFFALHLTPVWNWLYRIITTILKLRHEDYYITNQRIIVKKGIKKFNFTSVYIDNIFEITTKINFIDNLMKVADIHIKAEKTDVNLEAGYVLSEVNSIVLFDQHFPQDKVKLIEELKEKLINTTKKE